MREFLLGCASLLRTREWRRGDGYVYDFPTLKEDEATMFQNIRRAAQIIALSLDA